MPDVEISVISPVLNEEDNLRELLKDIESSNLRNYELVVVDGGSQDGTREVAKKYGARVVDGPQEGMAAARNKGLEEAKGEYILMADADFRFPNGFPPEYEKYIEEDIDVISWQINPMKGKKTFVEKIYGAEYEVNWKETYLGRFLARLGIL